MKIPSLTRSLFLSALLGAGNGCATHALWTRSGLDNWNEPADAPDLRLFLGPQNRDFLAVYHEYSERHDSVRTRAYWVYQNESRIAKRHRPEFVHTNTLRGLAPVSVFTTQDASTNAPDRFYAVMPASDTAFAIYSGQREISSQELPTYNDGLALPARIALTPLTVAADATIVGGAIGLYFLAEGGWTELNRF